MNANASCRDAAGCRASVHEHNTHPSDKDQRDSGRPGRLKTLAAHPRSGTTGYLLV
jgi:hypothetical protein